MSFQYLLLTSNYQSPVGRSAIFQHTAVHIRAVEIGRVHLVAVDGSFHPTVDSYVPPMRRRIVLLRMGRYLVQVCY